MRGSVSDRVTRLRLAGGLLLLSVFCMWWSPQWLTEPLARGIRTLAQPFLGMAAWTGFEIRSFGTFFGEIGELKTENARLRREQLRLLGDVAGMRSLAEENQELRSLLELIRSTDDTVIAAEVIGSQPLPQDIALLVNRGTNAGIRSGMAVVVGGNVLIGKVESAGPTTAVIRPLVHPQSVVSAVATTGAVKGVIHGDHGLGLIFDLALQSDTLVVGDSVVTSGLGDGLPKGLLVGTIERVALSPDRLFQQAVLAPPINPLDVRAVGIILHPTEL